jgi:hypothetical protein
MKLSMPRPFNYVRFVVAALLLPWAASADDEVSFSRDIRPILSSHCFACHGPDEAKREADLRLDVRDVAIESAIVPGKADKSVLVELLTSTDPEQRMPPVASKRPALSPKQISLIRRWIDQGAKYDAHWAYQTLKRPEVPSAKNAAWTLGAIDHFVAVQHEKQVVAPSKEADRRTLIRRLYFDLLGLPPTSKQVEDFTSNNSPDAYEKLVDDLLSSEHYGERMAMYWLDLVRYADTNGIHGDNHRDHDLYRDYVISAFNDNMPFDRFSTEQLAGDLLPNATKWQRVASGYNRLNMTTREGGAQAKEYLAKYSADRVRNASVVWLGSTMGCAECHNHKFDPFTTKDFYSFAAFFADIQETAVGAQKPIKLPTDEQESKLTEIDDQLVSLREKLKTDSPELKAAQVRWEEQAKSQLAKQKPAWSVVVPTQATSLGGAKLDVQKDQAVLTSGTNAAKDTYEIELSASDEKITGLRLEALTHSSFPAGGLSRANGNFVLTRFEVEVREAKSEKPQPVKLSKALSDFSQKGFPIEHAIDGKPNSGWAVEGHVQKKDRKAVFIFEKPLELTADAKLIVRMRHESQYAGHNIGRFRLALTGVESPTLSGESGIPADVAAALKIDPAKRDAKQQAALADYYRSNGPALKPIRDEIAMLEKRRKSVVDAQRPILVAMVRSPREMRVLPRGNWLDDSGDVVQPSVPGFLNPINVKDRRANRLDLANWLVDPQNPLVARVMVNRLWKLTFGKGLATSLDDFGAQGVVPSHPELLDWLAVEFIKSGWNIKHMLKLMVMSRAYRQSSFESKELRERDPANRWLARQNRFRLDAEMVRDNALSVAGLLKHRVGGASAKPYQPAGYWAHLNFPKRTYPADKGENQYRRGLYTYWCRTFLHPSLRAFDAPSREEACVERPRSNTPLQSLVLLNDPTYVEAARTFATSIMREGGATANTQIIFAIRKALSRKPNSRELEILTKLHAKHLAEFSKSPASAGELLSIGQSSAPSDLDKSELAAWTSVARVILNLHETITRN